MAKLTPMAPDSAGFKVLVRLHQLGGSAFIDQLTEVLWKEFRSRQRFMQIAAAPLYERRLICRVMSDLLTITPEGRLVVETHLQRVPAPRVVPRMTGAINVSKHFRFEAMRPGAMDYRKYPSVMGGERVPFHNSKAEEQS